MFLTCSWNCCICCWNCCCWSCISVFILLVSWFTFLIISSCSSFVNFFELKTFWPLESSIFIWPSFWTDDWRLKNVFQNCFTWQKVLPKRWFNIWKWIFFSVPVIRKFRNSFKYINFMYSFWSSIFPLLSKHSAIVFILLLSFTRASLVTTHSKVFDGQTKVLHETENYRKIKTMFEIRE